MTFAPADTDDPDEAGRIRAAMQAAAAIKQEALRGHLRGLGKFEALLVSKPVDMMDGADFVALNRMVWAYRRDLPPTVRRGLSIPPDDPIVRERHG